MFFVDFSIEQNFQAHSRNFLLLADEHMWRNKASLILLNVLTEWFFFFHENATFYEWVFDETFPASFSDQT
jgi:hypothetical protein